MLEIETAKGPVLVPKGMEVSLSRTAPSSRNGLPPPEMIPSSKNGSLKKRHTLIETTLLSTLILLLDHSREMRVSEININRRNIHEWKPIFYYFSYIDISR
jgi:hypothetical protein